MARSINFVRERRRTLTRKEQDDRKVLAYVTKGLIGLGVALLVVISVRLYLVYRIDQLQKAQKETQNKIVQLEDVEQEYTVFANKLKILTELFGKRKEKQEALAYFSSLFDKEVMISQLSYTADEELLSFVLKTSNIFSLEKVFNIINSDEVKQRYPLIEKDSLRRSQDGSYGMQINLRFGDEPTPLPSQPGDAALEGDSAAAPADPTAAPADTPAEMPTDTTGSTTESET